MATNFGKDISCTTGLRTGRYVSGLRLVAEAAYRRITTPRGRLRGGEAEADYGIDITAECGEAENATLAAALPARIENEVLKDERIHEAKATLTKTEEGGLVTYLIDLRCETDEGPFDLQLGVSGVSASLIGISS